MSKITKTTFLVTLKILPKEKIMKMSPKLGLNRKIIEKILLRFQNRLIIYPLKLLWVIKLK
jgi:hypothetical protein